MSKFIMLAAAAAMATGCSTNGEIYKEGDEKNGEFSIRRTVALPFAVAGVVAGAAVVGAAAAQPTYAPAGYPVAWRDPASGRYFCRNSATGAFIPAYNCA
jgi:hypothetical protein